MEFKEGDRVICIVAGYKKLIINKQYIIKRVDNDFIFFIDGGVFVAYSKNRFKLDTNYYRKEKLKQLRNEI
jgi:hypothetical protein